MAAVVAAFFFAAINVTLAADTNAPSSTATASISQPPGTNAPVKLEKPVKKAKVKARVKKQLSGAELYAINCNRCHPERDPSEFTAAQWDTMMIYMRVRANLPASQARAITKYLKEQAGN